MSTMIESLPSASHSEGRPSGQQQLGQQQLGQDTSSTYNPNMDLPVGGQGQDQTLDSSTIQELTSGLQEAISSGATSLPARDFPQSQEQRQDEQVQPNYVPPPSNRRIRFEDEDEDYADQNNNQNKNKNKKSESIFDELQTPLLLAILFFIFQLPIVRLTLYKYLPALYDLNGSQLNLIGICLCSVAFGFGYTFIQKIMGYIALF